MRRTGLSPLVRGKLSIVIFFRFSPGSIPACAGETAYCQNWTCQCWVYPRLCGGNLRPLASVVPVGGLSPLVRGKRDWSTFTPDQSGSIPACAGETWHRKLPEDFDRVYPRLCGGNCLTAQIDHPERGLSPLVRGKRMAE